MQPHSQLLASRKRRRRRRRLDRPPISAHLLLDDRMKDNVGILSEDLLHDLFPAYKTMSDTDTDTAPPILHVAVAPWQPTSLVSAQKTQWTILPVRAPPKPDTIQARGHSSLQFPASSPALQSFLHNLQALAPGGKALPPRRDAPLEIRILDVVPLGLETVFVSLDTEELRRLEEVHARFGGGFGDEASKGGSGGAGGRAAKKAPSPSQQHHHNHNHHHDIKALESKWRQAVRDALRAPQLVHTGDILKLPLATHPITHTSPPPAKIISCEPVSQGLLLPSTRIILLQSHKTGGSGSSSSRSHRPPSITTQPLAITNGIPEEDEGDDTSTDVFYSAAEDKSSYPTSSAPDEESTDDLRSETSATDHDDLSDDSEDGFSLMSPMLPPSTGIMSSYQSATPRPGFLSMAHGVQTPGSLRSGISASTARQGGAPRMFKAQGLLQKLPDDLLHPKPGADDDEEARVYVDTAMLVKIGCFSGDWVRVEAASNKPSNSFAPWKFGAAFGDDDDDNDEDQDFRAVKIYGIAEPGAAKKGAKMPGHKMIHGRTSSFFGMMGQGASSATSTAYASPVLLANLGMPAHVRIAPLGLDRAQKVASSQAPPNAKEVTLLKLATPLSLDRAMQPSLFTALKLYFERKQRIVKSGDWVAIAVDEALGRSVFQGADDGAEEEVLSKTKMAMGGRSERSVAKVAWFKIDEVKRAPAAGAEEGEPDLWGECALMDASNVKMVQAGSEQGRALSSIESSWPYYLGVKKAPAVPQSVVERLPGLAAVPEASVSSIRRRLRELVSAATSPQAIHLGLPPSAILLTSTQRQIGKAYNAEQACEDLGLHTFPIDAYDIVTESGGGGGDVKTEGVLRARTERAMNCGSQYTVILIKHIEALNAERMTTAFKEILAESRVIIATTTDVDKIPDGIRGSFTHELEMTAPDEGEREGILRSIVQNTGIRVAPDVELSSVAVKTAALVAGDLIDVIDRAAVAKQTRLESLCETYNTLHASDTTLTIRDIELAGGPGANALTKADFDAAVDAARKNFADSIGAPKIPNVGWDDVGGLTHVKEAVMETIQLPLARPELFAKGMKKRSGILFYGPPGTGKTLLAKAIATEFSLNFFSVKGPELLNMYIGESEANVRRVFQRARDARPCVVFFDELDSVAPKRGNQGDSGGVMDRIVSQLLAELDGMSDGEEGGGGVFVIGATNRPDLLDQALLRPGRFDKMLYLGISDTHEKQQTILEALTRKFTLHNHLSLQRVASHLPFTYTGADLYALCSDAMLKAITRQARLVDSKVATHNRTLPQGKQPLTVAGFFDHLATDEDTQVVVEEGDFEAARRELVPSVSFEELQHYERVRRTFEGNPGEQKNKKGEVAKPAIAVSGAHAGAITNGSANGNGNGNGNGADHPRSSSDSNTTTTSSNATKSLQLPPPIPQKPETGTTGRRSISAAKLKGLREKTLNSLHRSRSRGDGPKDKTNVPVSVASTEGDSDEDEYTIDTSHLANGNGNGNGKAVAPSFGQGQGSVANGKGKSGGSGGGASANASAGGGGGGKGKSGFGDGAEDEELYT